MLEEVPAHMHPGPIVFDVLMRQHEHRSGLIWSGDRETSITDLQCRRFGRNLFQAYSGSPSRLMDIIDRMGLGGVFRCGYIGSTTLLFLLYLVHVRYPICCRILRPSTLTLLPPPSTSGSSTPHMPISYASSSDSYEHDDERTDEVTPT
ncbi:hypothetical protein M9H77_35381 [Catharanthus roseus]|uniref:Uncharacterized protein n=1 Tax=Catharanthus roseus TaxID=4058 RepID=A0ACB9ZRE7_CATRO|nr:hypothetical protein M9H77_35381 [Catharanthus roseus]